MYKTGELCPICETGLLKEEKIEEKSLNFKGISFVVKDYLSYQCDTCGEGIISRKTDDEIEKIVGSFMFFTENKLEKEET